MLLNITYNGIVYRREEGTVILCRPGQNGGPGPEVEVEAALADAFRLATGDVVEGVTESLPDATGNEERVEEAVAEDEQFDEPAALRGETVPAWLVTRTVPSERLVSIAAINGLTLAEAEARPSPRKRSAYEHSAPDRLIRLATGPDDTTGRVLDFAAPFAVGYAGIVTGSHASGLTRTLRAVVQGVSLHAPDLMIFVLLIRARSEETTDWRRRFPQAEVVVCPTAQGGATPEQTVQMADLVLECALRQTELGRHVLLAVDSLTGLWSALLEQEEADAQFEADRSRARRHIREWIQKAGNFAGEGLLGSGLGGSLTLVGTVWHAAIDTEAEEERELHPHLRLLEHILHETTWRVPLSGALAHQRLYPAIDVLRCHSQYEASLLPPDAYERLLEARRSLTALGEKARFESMA